MAKDKKAEAGGADGVVGSSQCTADGCKKKIDRAGFCPEHFEWFKAGLVTKRGIKPTDFDKKYQAFMARKKGVAQV